MSDKTLNLKSLSKIPSKISGFYAKMSTGKKIYAGFWLVTGIFLIVFIAIVSVFAPKIGGKVYNDTNSNGKPASYLVTPHPYAGEVLPKEDAILLDAATIKSGYTAIPGVTTLADALKAKVDGKTVTTDAFKIYDLTKASGNVATTKDADGKNQYFYTWGNGIKDNSQKNGEWSSISPSSEATQAQNSIAGIGLGFAVALMGSVASTVIVSVKEAKLKKAKKGGVK